MSSKTNPKIMRIPEIKDWEIKWFASRKEYAKYLSQTISIRKFLEEKLRFMGIDKINIEKIKGQIKIIIYTSKPGLIIGRGGVDIENLKKEIKNKFLSKEESLEIQVYEVKTPMLSASIIVENIIQDLEKRVRYRKAMKRALASIKKGGALGAKILLSGRLDGVEIARKEKLQFGKMPILTLRSDIDYAKGVAFTTYGAIGVKVWIYKGEKLPSKNES